MCVTMLLAGCGTYHNYQTNNSTAFAGSKLFVAIGAPFVGVHDTDAARLTAVAFADAAKQRYDYVRLADAYSTLEGDLNMARAAHCDVLMRPTVLVWQDNATPWSGKPDQVEFEVEIYSVASDSVISTVDVKDSGGFFDSDNVHPQDLLQKTFTKFFAETAK